MPGNYLTTSSIDHPKMEDLVDAIQTTPIIDNHAHPLLRPDFQAKYNLLAITTEAGGDALENTSSTLAHIRAVEQLSTALRCEATWDAVVTAIELQRSNSDGAWAQRCLEGIETILVDDGLDGRHEVFDYDWHDRLTRSHCKRIVRIEKVAEDIIESRRRTGAAHSENARAFIESFRAAIRNAIQDPEVVGFKSVVCYRTGLNIPEKPTMLDCQRALEKNLNSLEANGTHEFKRVDNPILNDFLVHETAILITNTPAEFKKPLQFHTGLGDNDIILNTSSPSHLQKFIKSYPIVPIVLLHASYPWTQEAGYLATVYENVYADIGEVFPMISKDGQNRIIREILEFCPTEKILWSTDGHWFPETYLLAVIQIREALQTVLCEYVEQKSLTILQAIRVVEDIFFNTSNAIYNLKLPLIPLTKLHPPLTIASKPFSTGSDFDLVTAFLKENPSVKFLRLQYLDYTATLRLRLIPMKRALSQLRSGGTVSIGITKAALGLLQNDHICGDVTASGEYRLQAIFSTLRLGPVPGYASVQGEFRQIDGKEVTLCPRTILRSTLEHSSNNNLEFLVGFEVEIVFLKMSASSDGATIYSTLPNSTAHAWSTSTAFQDANTIKMVSEMVTTLSEFGIDVEQFHPESATGQYEFVLPCQPPLEAVDSLLHAREVITSIAARNGLRATVVPKPFSDMAGSACHAHMSISTSASSNTKVYESFYAGVLKHLRSITAITYSSIASYERLVDGCWAGGRWITWGTQNRETPLRKISGSHWEFKCLDGLANMYLALASIFSAGTQGVIDNERMQWKDCQADPSTLSEDEQVDLGINQMFPGSLEESLDCLERDEVMSSLLGRRVVERYIGVKRAEIDLLGVMSKEERRNWIVARY